MHYFVVSHDDGDEFNSNRSFTYQLKKILAEAITPNTETIFLNPHNARLLDSHFSHETDKKRQLTVVNWGHHNNRKPDSSQASYWLSHKGLCSDTPFEPSPSETEIVFYAENNVALASFDTTKNRLYLLWDAIHYRSDKEVEMFKNIISFYAKKLSEHPLFQPAPPPEEQGYNQTITFNQSIVAPQLTKFKQDYQEKQNSINSYRTHMMNLLATTKELSRQIAVLESAQGIPPLTIRNKWVRHIDVSSGGFSVFTHPLFITYVDKDLFRSHVNNRNEYYKYKTNLTDILENLGKKYGWYVGQFRIDVDLMNDWKIRFHNLDNKRIAYWHDGSESSCHPHVNGRGKGCLGDLSELIAHTQSNFEIEPLIDILISYIQSSNLEDPAGESLYKWDLVDMITLKNVLTNKQIVINPVKIDRVNPDIEDGEMPVGD